MEQKLACHQDDLGCVDGYEFKLKFNVEEPVRHKATPLPLEQRKWVKEYVE
jgi:hypothetical protein